MPRPVTIASRNSHKTREIRQILGPEFAVRDLSDYPDLPEIEETGKTFEENAGIKAVALSKHVAGVVIADDSGLETDALDGAPGVYSARYSGSGDDRQNLEKLLRELDRIDPAKQRRTARFRCALAIAQAGKLLRTFCGTVEGRIIEDPRGTSGFGYDPIFVPDGFVQTFSELPASAKNRLSHRSRALALAIPFLRAQVLEKTSTS